MDNEIVVKCKLVIVGGGSSGLMTAACAIKYGKILGSDILILEKNNELGKKLKISGGGRCNIFNAEYDTQLLLNNYGQNKKYLYSAFESFDAVKSREFFKELGIDVKIEDRKRAFPISEKAVDVFDSLYNFLLLNKVNIICNASNIDLVTQENTIKSIKFKSLKDLVYKEFVADKYVLATGGYSHPETGSTGDGFRLMEKLGTIKINTPNPSIVPLISPLTWVHSLSGKVVENIKITIKVDNVKKKVIKNTDNTETKNRILFTHFGLSGPTILNNSKYINDCLSEGQVDLCLDLFPDLDDRQMDKFLLRVFDENKNKKIKNILNEIYEGNILEIILSSVCANLDLEKQVNDIKKEERKILIQILKNIKIKITGLSGYEKAIIADGGVDCSEINFKDMTLKKISNLAVTGDMIDISRPSGGYSLQLCWTTGFLAAKLNQL
jgi:predicted Rossmann fold flavoprotein